MSDMVRSSDAVRSSMRMHQHLHDSWGEGEAAEKAPVRGRLEVWRNGEKVHDEENLIVTAGHNMLAHRFWGQSSPPDAISHVAIGTGDTAAAAGNTTLGTEVHRNATATFTRANNVLTVTASFGNNEGDGLIAEAGLFNAASSGTMFARTLLNPARQKNTADTLDITWTLTF